MGLERKVVSVCEWSIYTLPVLRQLNPTGLNVVCGEWGMLWGTECRVNTESGMWGKLSLSLLLNVDWPISARTYHITSLYLVDGRG